MRRLAHFGPSPKKCIYQTRAMVRILSFVLAMAACRSVGASEMASVAEVRDLPEHGRARDLPSVAEVRDLPSRAEVRDLPRMPHASERHVRQLQLQFQLTPPSVRAHPSEGDSTVLWVVLGGVGALLVVSGARRRATIATTGTRATSFERAHIPLAADEPRTPVQLQLRDGGQRRGQVTASGAFFSAAHEGQGRPFLSLPCACRRAKCAATSEPSASGARDAASTRAAHASGTGPCSTTASPGA